jgi:replicative DNA helicase
MDERRESEDRSEEGREVEHTLVVEQPKHSFTVTKPEQPSLDIEQEFTFHLAIQDSLEYILREGISNELLLAPRTKAVFQFVQHHFSDTGKMPSLKVLKTEFPQATFDEPETTIQYIIDKLRERYQRNKVEKVIIEVAKVAQKQPGEAMKILRDEVFEIERNSLSSRSVVRPGDHVLFIRDLQEKVMAGHFSGVTVGFKEIDSFTGGLKDGNLAYILARPKRQKTFFWLEAFIGQAKEGKNPIAFTLENTLDEIQLRISCKLSGFPWDQAQKGNFAKKDYELLNSAWSDFSKHEWTLEMPNLDERTIPALMIKADKADAGSVLISQFKYLKGLKDWYPTETAEHAEIAVDLKRAAIRPGYERPFYVEAQFNRGGDSMEELEDFNASKVGLTDMIPQAADTLYGLFQNKDQRANNTVEFGILEARNHGKGAWYIETEYIASTKMRLITGSLH